MRYLPLPQVTRLTVACTLCDRCGAIVFHQVWHDEWHLNVQLRSEKYDGE